MTEDERAIKHVLVTHTRMIAYKPGTTHQCACGWSGDGTKGKTLYDHLARKIAKAISAGLKIATTRCTTASPHTIEMHRAANETLCSACSSLLSRLK